MSVRFTEEQVQALVAEAMANSEPGGDPGFTMDEWASKLSERYGRPVSTKWVSSWLRSREAEGYRVVPGKRPSKRIDGQPCLTNVYRVEKETRQ